MRKPPSPIPISCIESQLYPEQGRLPASRMKEAIAILRPLVESTKTLPGCADCKLYRDVLEDTVLVFHESWNDEEGLR